MGLMKDFLGKRKKIIIFIFIFLVGFVFGWIVQADRVYKNCVKWTEGNPACAMYQNYF